MIEVFITDLRKLTGSYDLYLEALPPKRRAKAERYLLFDDRLRCLAGGLLMKKILGVQTDEDLIQNPYGKPELKSNRRHFNLSHGGDYVVLAVDLLPVGVDIERIENVNMAVAQRCFRKDELEFLTEGSDKREEKFFSLWTLKESLMKATGFGLHLQPESFSVLPLGTPFSRLDGNKWYFKQYKPDKNHMISVCAAHQAFAPALQEIVFA